jgi:SAM-dependent methyltransferase
MSSNPVPSGLSASTPTTMYCPGCSGARFVDGQRLTNQPVMLNYRCLDQEAAKTLGAGTVQLRECQTCGLIFNATFDINLIRYDSAYDNRQGFSGVFRKHLESVADQLMQYLPSGGRVLEVGCGKGEFMRLLRDRGCTRCVGYDTSCPDNKTVDDAGIEYHCCYVTSDLVNEHFDLIVCRHVVEHVPEIGVFLESLAAISKAAGNAAIVIETPEFGWIVGNGCFWDYFYEHCNYFTFEALEELCRLAGLEVISHQRVFGDQYQFIVVKPSSNPIPALAVTARALSRFIDLTTEAQKNLETKITLAATGRSWAIWGAGAKGVTLASRLPVPGLAFVIDSNPAKAGCFLPGSGIPVVSPSDPRIADLALVVIANPMYQAEILGALRLSRFTGTTLVV